MAKRKKTLIPTDLRDYISLAGMFSALSLFFKFFLNKDFFVNSDALFFILMGIGLLVTGKVFTIHKWTKDGIQRNEYLFAISLVIGLLSLIAGSLILFGIELPTNLSSVAGIVAGLILVVIGVDYLAKNKKK